MNFSDTNKKPFTIRLTLVITLFMICYLLFLGLTSLGKSYLSLLFLIVEIILLSIFLYALYYKKKSTMVWLHVSMGMGLIALSLFFFVFIPCRIMFFIFIKKSLLPEDNKYNKKSNDLNNGNGDKQGNVHIPNQTPTHGIFNFNRIKFYIGLFLTSIVSFLVVTTTIVIVLRVFFSCDGWSCLGNGILTLYLMIFFLVVVIVTNIIMVYKYERKNKNNTKYTYMKVIYIGLIIFPILLLLYTVGFPILINFIL